MSTHPTDDPRPLAVVYDKGAVHPVEAVTAIAPLAPTLFLVAPSDHAQRLLPVMRQLGEARVLADDIGADVSALRGRKLGGIVTFSEKMVPRTAALADRLSLPYHSLATTRLLTDKYAQRERLRMRGVDTTRSAPIHRLADWPRALRTVGLPAVLKPLRGGGSRDTYPIDDPDTGLRLATQLLDGVDAAYGLVLEELLRGRDTLPVGDYVSVESAVVQGRIRHLAVTGKLPQAEPFREVGQFWPACAAPGERARILDLTTKALEALEIQLGVTHTEVKLTADGPRIIEVNGRLGGHLNELSRRATGIDLVRIAAGIALGRPVDDVPPIPSRVFWQFRSPAPLDAVSLDEASGGRDVAGIPGITRYVPYLKPGERIDAGVMTNPLDLVCGDADDHRAMAAQIDRLKDVLSYRFTFHDGRQRTLSARALAPLRRLP
ncbi:ATP-grasp domain-containing protein [Krasilnikovia sp. MM14-A1004]|uniref:ATP-grasp domain-containing protein n=1 Tax=Krasilnikovia sp. MM14-A1004 TaxID=3373541 RepID=UPI00399D4164